MSPLYSPQAIVFKGLLIYSIVMTQESVPAMVFRGGTTKGVYFQREDMPADESTWEDLLLDAFGSPDPMQIDGIGGSHSTASKAMIVSPAPDEAIDVRYRFGQVGVEKPVVDWGGNCGNLTFAIGPYALEEGIVNSDDLGDRVDLVLENVNTGNVVEQSVPIAADGSPEYSGDFKVYGVPGTGSRVRSRFVDPGGSVTGAVFPTGNRTDVLSVPDVGDVEVSLVDVASPCVFARAGDVGLDVTSLPHEIDADDALLDRLERVRSAACARYGFVADAADATDVSPGIPKMVVVGEREPYETSTGETVPAGDYDLLARIMSLQKPHHAYAVTGAMSTAVAAVSLGTIPAEYFDGERDCEGKEVVGHDDVNVHDERVRDVVIGHPKGTMRVGVELDGEDVKATDMDRTARPIMCGDLFYEA